MGVKQETPRVKGRPPQEERPPANEGGTAQDPYQEMDKRDEEQIRASLTGRAAKVELLYLIPFGSKEDGRIDYGKRYHDSCSYCRNKTKKHVHTIGISVQGVDEIARIYGGIHRKILGAKKLHTEGKYKWLAEAAAMDIHNGNGASATAEQVCTMRRGRDDSRADLDRVIAERKAERNAVRKLLPQGLMLMLQNRGDQGNLSFTPGEIKGYMKENEMDREEKKAKYSLYPAANLYPLGDGMPSLPSGEKAPSPKVVDADYRTADESPPPPESEHPNAQSAPPKKGKKAQPTSKPSEAKIETKEPKKPLGPETHRPRLKAWFAKIGCSDVVDLVDGWLVQEYAKAPENMTPEEFAEVGKQLMYLHENAGKDVASRAKEFKEIIKDAAKAYKEGKTSTKEDEPQAGSQASFI